MHKSIFIQPLGAAENNPNIRENSFSMLEVLKNFPKVGF
jgi:hypothetical protein